MNRLFIILAVVTGISAGAWAYLYYHKTSAVPDGATPAGELPACCQKSPSRTTLLQAKPPEAKPASTPIAEAAQK